MTRVPFVHFTVLAVLIHISTVSSAPAGLIPTTIRADVSLADQVYQTTQDVRRCMLPVTRAAEKYRELRAKQSKIEAELDATCKNLKSRTSDADATSQIFKSFKNIPLGKLPKLAGLFEKSFASLKTKLDNPKKDVCDSLGKLRQAIDKFDTSPTGKAVNTTTRVIVNTEKFLAKVDDLIAKWNLIKNGICITPSCASYKYCPGFVEAYNDLVKMYESCQRISVPLVAFTNELETMTSGLDKNLMTPTLSVGSALRKLADSPLGKVKKVAGDLADTTIRLPAAGTKFRGVGKVPNCCPSGYEKEKDGNCYKKCNSNERKVALVTCQEKCRSGYRLILAVCKRKKFLSFKTYIPKTRFRAPRPPVFFGGRGCACRSDGRTHYEDLLCKRKCGAGAFAGYPTPVGPLCIQTGLKSFTLSQLLGVLDIFEKIKKVPGIGDILKVADAVINTVLKPIENLVAGALDVNIPLPNFATVKIAFSTLEAAVQNEMNSFEQVANKNPVIDFDTEGLCVTASLK